MTDTIIEALYDYFAECELINGEKIHIDYLPEKAIQYSIDVVPCNPIIKKYVDGTAKNQYLFVFGSREYYSAEVAQNLSNIRFYEDIADWIDEKSKNGELPKLKNGKEALRIEVLSSGYAIDSGTDNARYQIQCRLTYIDKGVITND